MKKFWRYIKKVSCGEGEFYHAMNKELKKTISLICHAFVFTILLATHIGRVIIQWFAYIFIGCSVLAFASVVLLTTSNLVAGYKKFKTLEANGTSIEEQEEMRRHLCEMEGDDGFSVFVSEIPKECICILDSTALIAYANRLYGPFLAQSNFENRHLKLDSFGENVTVYTTKMELQKLRAEETIHGSDAGAVGIFNGYTDYVARNIECVPKHKLPTDKLIFVREDGKEETPSSREEICIATALALKNWMAAEVILISNSPEIRELAGYSNLRVESPIL